MSTGVCSGELFAVLSLATDLATGQVPEHGLRTCLLAMEIADQLGAEGQEVEDVYYLGLLHSIGCTADAPQLARQMGDDIAPKMAFTLVDPARPRELLAYLWRNVYPNAPRLRRAGAFSAALAAGPSRPRENLRSHCEVGQRLGERLGLPAGCQAGLQFVFERWDGKGMPDGTGGEGIPRPARILHTARDAAAFAAAGGPDVVVVMAERSAGNSLEPSLAALLRERAPDLLGAVNDGDAWRRVLELEPRPRVFLGEQLDQACCALADYTDLKSYGTVGHSRAVAEVAEAAAWRLGMEAGAVEELRRAAWLHDLGRVAISSAIWEKPGPLSTTEGEQVRLASYQTERLLSRVPAFAELGLIAAATHERMDGSGYHRGVPAGQLPVAARVLAVAETWCAMREPRAHRPARASAAAATELRDEARRGKLDGAVVDAVLAAVGEAGPSVTAPPAGLTAREVEVLRLIARGATSKQAAAELGIAPKTVRRHVESIYLKIGASTRAAAALFAVEQGLLQD